MIVCIDIGGGTTRVGFSSDGKTFDNIIKFPTPEDFDEEMNKITEEIKKAGQNIEKISFGAAGSVDRKEGKIVRWGQNHSWWDQSVFVPLKKEFPDASLKLENDADIAGLGEAVFGIGKAYSSIGYLTLSTGVGGTLVNDKKIEPFRLGSEQGHMIVNFDETEEWICGQKGCYEMYASGTGFKKRFGVAAEDCDDVKIWEEYAKLVAIGVANMVLLYSPEVMIIGGGISNKFDMFVNPLKAEVKRLLGAYDNLMPQILKAELDEPGLYGGLVL